MSRPARALARALAAAAVGAGGGLLGLGWAWALPLAAFVWALLASGWALRVGLAISGVALAYFLHGLDFAEMAEALAHVRWFWLAPAVASGFSLYAVKAYRWRILLKPVKTLGFWRLFRASLMGFMVNCILPARIGEFVRAGAVAMRGDVRVATVFATILVERVFDLFGVIFYFGMCVVLLWSLLTRPEVSGMMSVVWIWGGIFTGAFLAASATLVALKLFPETILALSDKAVRGVFAALLQVARVLIWPAPRRWKDPILDVLARSGEAVDRKSHHVIENFMQGLRVIKGPAQVLWLCVLSLVHWGFAILINYFVGLCFEDLGLSPLGAALVFVFTAFAVALPSAPGFIGVFQVATEWACRALAIPAGAVVKSYAMVLWIMVNAPVVAGGFACLAYEGISFAELRTHGERAMAEEEAALPGEAQT